MSTKPLPSSARREDTPLMLHHGRPASASVAAGVSASRRMEWRLRRGRRSSLRSPGGSQGVRAIASRIGDMAYCESAASGGQCKAVRRPAPMRRCAGDTCRPCARRDGVARHRIAPEPCLSLDTVKSHLQAVKYRLGVPQPSPGVRSRLQGGRNLDLSSVLAQARVRELRSAPRARTEIGIPQVGRRSHLARTRALGDAAGPIAGVSELQST